MGYRSQVVLALDAKIVPHFMAALSQEPEAKDLVFKYHDNLTKNYMGEGNLLVSWDQIKWYDSYPEVSKINQFISNPSDFGEEYIDGEDPERFFRFIKIGEEYNDVQTEGWGFEDIYVSRSIEGI